MFDIEKARKRGMDEKTIKIMEKINENNQRCDECTGHEFNHGDHAFGAKITCKNCGYEADISYVKGYEDALRHTCAKANEV